MLILITGAAGFVGSHLADAIVQSFGSDADLLLTGSTARCNAHLPVTRMDITDQSQVEATIASYRPTHVFHLAGIASPAHAAGDPCTAWRVHLDGTLHVARALLQYSPEAVLVMASSALVYGATARSGNALTEKCLLAPIDDYGASKAAADLALGALAEQGLRSVRLRLFNHFGPGQSDRFVIARFARQIARIQAGLEPPTIKVGNLTPKRDFLDVRDVVTAYLCTMQKPVAPGSIFNIASGRAISISEMLDHLIALSGMDIRVEEDRRFVRKNELPILVGNAERAKRELGWSPCHETLDTIRDVLAYWQRAVAKE